MGSVSFLLAVALITAIIIRRLFRDLSSLIRFYLYVSHRQLEIVRNSIVEDEG